jgi:hypothetical protein
MGIFGSSPSEGIDVCLPFLRARVVLRKYGPRDGLIPYPRRPTKYVYVVLVSGRAAQAASSRLLTQRLGVVFQSIP